MSRRNIAEEWKLENGGEQEDQWKLQPAEQNAISQWQLQEERGAAPVQSDWQPVNYTRDRREPRGNWILPSLVGVALVAVIAYVAWIAISRAGLLGPTTPVAEPTPAAVAEDPAVDQATPPASAPTDTPAAPTPTPEPTLTPTLEPSPTPVPLVNLESITVPTLGGVNARRTPELTGEVIQILPQGEARYLVIAEQGEWLQVALPDGQLAWVAAEFVQRTTATVTVEEANQQRAAVGLEPLAAPAPVEGAPAITETSTSTLTTPLTGPVAISVTINVTTGLNARETPALGATVVELLAGNTTYSAVARTADSQWVQILLPDGRLAWVSTQFITAAGDVNSLSTEPLTPNALAPAVAAPLTTTQPITTSPALTETTPATTTTAPSVTQVADGVTASVTGLSGANARAIPEREAESLQVLAFDSVLPVVGRSANNEWVQVTLSEGQLAWVLVSAVTLNADLETLPVVTP
jgi:SH3-like domain-containing protein